MALVNQLYRFYRLVTVNARFLNLKKTGSLWNSIHGFYAATAEICGVTRENYKEFLSDRDYSLAHPYNKLYSPAIDKKLYLPMLLHRYIEYVPEYYLYKDKFGYLPLSDIEGYSCSSRYDSEVFFAILKQKKILALKMSCSSTGFGFMVVKREQGEYYLNNVKISESDLKRKMDSLDDYIISEYVIQHPYSSNVCATSLNTIRFLCVWDESKREFYIPRSFHRFGCGGNIVDNTGSGDGILVFVDPSTGKIKDSGVFNFKHKGLKYAENIIHPDKGIALTGMEIPGYLDVKAKVLEIANSISFMRYMGIDVAITEAGFKIIEINSLPALDGAQQREGLLLDPNLRKLFRK